MTVYVDDMYRVPLGKYRRMAMSHMVADTDAELFEMADRIGVARKWHQSDHFDICKSKRALAIAAGAVPITLRALALMVANRKAGLGLGDPATAHAVYLQRRANHALKTP